MPTISKLVISNFRNIGSVSIEPSPQVNLFVGPNGSGKSSLLESLSVISCGKSFRTHKYRNLIKDDCQELVLYGQLHLALEQGEIETSVGLSRSRRGEFKIRLGDRNISSSAELAASLPFVLINSDSFRLLEGGPAERRQFFDWLVFHVKHEFRDQWKQLNRCIKQRNSLLRRDNITYKEVMPWDVEIDRLASLVDAHRRECIDLLHSSLKNLLKDLDGLESFEEKLFSNLSLEYKKGWKSSASNETDSKFEGEQGEQTFLSLRQQLENNFSRETQLGYTSVGPHKADLTIKLGTKPAIEVLSRGQQKLLISALHIAKASVFSELTGRYPFFAVDDLPSELDRVNLGVLVRWLLLFQSQIFVTSIDEEAFGDLWEEVKHKDVYKMFHVKHGTINQIEH